jgi:DNA helicase-2/ATP-dependent DNA helicase PcrA
LLCYELLRKRPDILKQWQQKYTYVLIDEFQDINRVQYDTIRLLAAPENNLFIVGDDDQSIYQFRGARPEIMLNFPKDYPAAGQVLLNYNYRSQEAIVKAAGRLIGNNSRRI